ALVPVGDAGATATAVRRRLELAPSALAELAARLRGAAIERGEVTASLGAMETEYRRLVGRR
ncbi:MAG TPA: hypothetical protein VEY67_04685, partial [Candidatus Dormibacteraeota bacterium]|nr:hypothetical protein [Candidatus Dormibacteraeota bacterium]